VSPPSGMNATITSTTNSAPVKGARLRLSIKDLLGVDEAIISSLTA
jgi:hypothetical protein